MDQLIEILSGYTPLSLTFKDDLKQSLVRMLLPKHHSIQKAPQVPTHLYYLESGFAITFRFADGQKAIDQFWKPGQIIGLTSSFCLQRPSFQFVQLVADSSVLHLSYADVQRLLTTYSESAQIGKSLWLEYFDFSQQRLQDLRTMLVVDQHRKLLAEYPGVEQYVPQEQIASYLGITPQSLSRIKRQHRS